MRTKLLAIPFLLAVGCAGPMDAEDIDDGSPEATSDPASEEVAEAQQALVADPSLIPLVTFYSAARGDYFTTSNPAWTCGAFGTCSVGSGYRVIGIAGYVHRPDRPRPAGTATLYHWWSPSRGDNFLTSDPAWRGVVGDATSGHDGYRLFRIEGHIDVSASAGSVPLDSYWAASVRDNASVNARRVRMPTGYTRYRTEGFLRGPGTASGRRCYASAAPFRRGTPWTVAGNFDNTWPDSGHLRDSDTLSISAFGHTRIDFWGTHKNVAGEGPAPDGAGYLAPGEPAYSLVGRVTSGRIWVPKRGFYEANVWFPIGASSGCLEYDAGGRPPGQLVLSINDSNRGDNAGGPTATVDQYK